LTKPNNYSLSNHYLSLIHKHLDNKLPFVWFRPAGDANVQVWLQQDVRFNTYNPRSKSKGFVFAPFDKAKPVLIFPDDQCTSISVPLWDAPWTKIQTNKLSSEDQKIYEERVAKAIETIKISDLKKVVLSRAVTYDMPKMDCFAVFSTLAQSYSTAFTYALYHPQIGLWVGATPEQLVRVDRTRLETVALAGTALWNSVDSLNWGEKEKTEQQLVVEDIRETLASFTDHWKISDSSTVQAGPLAHLKTAIEVQLKEDCLDDVFSVAELLHPTAAVCGFPRLLSLEFVRQIESHDREYYTGFLGSIDEGTNRLDLYVNLRCMKVEGGKSVLYAGGGLTKDSIPSKEYEETEQKLDTIRQILFA